MDIRKKDLYTIHKRVRITKISRFIYANKVLTVTYYQCHLLLMRYDVSFNFLILSPLRSLIDWC